MKKLMVFMIILLGAILFYWLQIRPSQIRKNCYQWIIDQPGEIENDLDWSGNRDTYNALYNSCLHKEGLW